ncbi:MAG TPA: TonB-dependent receptor [Anaeromyxobacteraceae bacterium]
MVHAIAVAASMAVALAATPPVAGPEPVVRPPVLVRAVEARYPPGALAARLEGEVGLELTVGLDGLPSDVTVVRSAGPEFDAAAIEAVTQWRFTPARQGGEPVAVRITVPFAFRRPAEPPPPPAGPPVAGPAAPPPAPSANSPSAPGATAAAPPAPEEAQVLDATVRGRARPPSRGSADYQVQVGQLALVPRKNAAELLKLAPGILLTNEGGEGHAQQIFLRGFDARQGQDVEITVAGVPVNEVGNLHGNGYADVHFVIPEVVASLRVLEGPFDPHQGNFAVAGSAEYELGLDQRGLTLALGAGTSGTRRVLATWGPQDAPRATFGAVELYDTAGFGRARAAQRGSAIAQHESRLGADTLRLTFQGYTARFQSAGLLREDDFRSGRVGFFDAYDLGQGGDASRFSASAEIDGRAGGLAYRHQAFYVRGSSRLRENFTGFLLDVQEPQQTLHPQRGDLIDRHTEASTVGLRSEGRTRFGLLGRQHEAAAGALARLDWTDGQQYRVQASNGAPYALEIDLGSRLADVGAFADLSLSVAPWLTLRGGFRADLFTFDVLDRCAVQSVDRPNPADPPLDRSCLSQQNLGRYREPVQRNSTSSLAVMPRVTAVFTPLPGLGVSAAYGEGVRSIDPQYVGQDLKTPFASARSVEVGATWTTSGPSLATVVRGAGFQTRVDKDLIFSESAGRNVLGGGSTRTGALLAGRATGRTFDLNAHATLVRATFDDTRALIPYVPDLVSRLDGSVFSDLPWPLAGAPVRGTLATGVTYVGRRPIPFGQRAAAVLTVDASASLGWRALRLALEVTNLLDARYRVGEFNFASDWNTQPQPTLVPVRHFSAGPPRQFLFTLELRPGGAP